MKNKNCTTFLFSLSVIVCSAILVLANEDQNEAKLQNSSLKSSQNDLPKVVQVLQLRKDVTNNRTTEKISEVIIETSLAKNETTKDQSPATETTEDINQNVTTESSVLPKNHAVTSVPEEFFENEFMLEQSYSAPLTLDELDNYSCFDEASTFGHIEATGVLMHEAICEFRKLWHYTLIAFQNLKTEFQIESPIETEEAIILLTDFLMSDTILDILQQGMVQLEILLENSEHLNNLLDTIDKCVPMSNIHETVSRFRVAFENFFIHLQGLVIYLEPHETIENYMEILKKLEETWCVMTEKILSLFDIHLETEMNLLMEFISLARSLLKRFSFEHTFEQNLAILKEFLDTLHDTYKQYHASESSESIIDKVQKVISTFTSNLLPEDFDVSIVHFVLPDDNVATLFCDWKAKNETSSDSQLISPHHNLISICKEKLLKIFEIEANLLLELSTFVKLLFHNLSSEKTFDEYLTALKDFIDSFSDICKKYYKTECLESIVDKVQTFISTSLSKDHNVPLLHFKLSNESVATLSCSWQMTNKNSSSSPAFSPKLNVTSLIVEDVIIDRSKNETQSMALFELLVSENSTSISTNNSTSPVSAIRLPDDCNSTKDDPSPSKAKSSEPISTNNNVPSFATTEQPEDTSVPLAAAPQMPQTVSSHSDSCSTETATIPDTVSSNPLPVPGTNIQVEQQPPVSLYSENTDNTLDKNPAVSSISGTPADLDTNNPPILPPSEEPANLPANGPSIAPCSPEEPADLSANNPPIASPIPEKPADLSTNNLPISPIISGKSVEPVENNPPVPSLSAEKPAEPPVFLPLPERSPNFSPNNPPIPLYLPGRPTSFSDDSPSIYSSSPVGPTDFPGNSPPISSYFPGRPTDFPGNNPPISSYFPERPTDFPGNNPPISSYSPERPTDFPGNNPPISSYFPGRPTDFPGNNQPVFPLPPERPTDFYGNNQPVFPPPSGRPIDFPGNNQPVFPLPPERPVDFSDNGPIFPPHSRRPTDFPDDNQPDCPLPPERPVDFSDNGPIFPPHSGRPTDFSDDNQPDFPFPPERPVDFSDNGPIFPPHSGRPTDFSDQNHPDFSSPERSSPSVLFPVNYDRKVEKNYNEPPTSYTPPSYLIPASDIIRNLPRYQPLSGTYSNYLDSADAFYKSLYSYLQYGNPAVTPPPNVSNKISELLRRGFPPSLPMTMDNPNLCGTSTFLPALPGLNNILRNDIGFSQLPLYLPRKEIASALGNTVLTPGDWIVILPKNGVRLIGQIVDTVGPIHFKAYEVKTVFTNPQGGIKIWHLRSGDFRNPECEQQLESLLKH